MEPTHGLDAGFFLASVDLVVREGLARSVWPAAVGLACCAIEFMATGGPDYDMARYGWEVYRPSPRQADLLCVSGRLSQKMAPVLRQVYDQMPNPKWVIAMGACASSGGMFNNYAVVQGVDHVIPVDIYLPGCPPRPEMLMNAFLALHEEVRTRPFHEGLRSEVSRRVEAAALERSAPTALLPLSLG